MHVGTFPVQGRTLCGKYFNFKISVFAMDTQAGQAQIITELISAL